MRQKLFHVTFLLIFGPVFQSQIFASETFIDTHIHYNWDQAELIDTHQVIDKIRRNNINLAIVSSTPNELALQLRQAGDDIIVAFFSPYTHPGGKRDWFLSKRIVPMAEAGLQSGQYRGIGEIHFMSGFQPKVDNPIFKQLMQLTIKYNVPALIHVDAANQEPFLSICKSWPTTRISFAHAGGSLNPSHIEAILQQCENVWIEFSARDPWRYGGITNESGTLLNQWQQLVLKYPDRFITGTDPVWRVTRTQSWDQADDGWDYYEKLLRFHRNWIGDLPATIQKKIKLTNAQQFLGNPH